MPDAIDRLDDALDDAWEALRGNPVIDRIFYTASEAADFSVLWHTLGVAQAIAKNDPKIAIALSVARRLPNVGAAGALRWAGLAFLVGFPVLQHCLALRPKRPN